MRSFLAAEVVMSSACSKNAYCISVVKRFAERSLWRPRMRLKDNIKVDFREIIVRKGVG
jgi:hypothetical protein